MTTCVDTEGPSCPVSCRDAAATIVADVFACRQLAEAAPQAASTLRRDAVASSSVLNFQMPLSDYAVLGPDACVALASSQAADPAVQVVVVVEPGATHVLTREVSSG